MNGLRLVYYINSRVLCVRVCVCVCVCVCVSVISNSSGTRGRSAMPLSPTWRASPGELHQLLLELTRRVVREEKPLELFHWERVKPRPLRYNGAILKKLVVFQKRVELLCLQLRRRKVEERLRCVGSFAKAGWKLLRSGTGYGFRGTG